MAQEIEVNMPPEAGMDISYWYRWVKQDLQGICPNCLLNLNDQSPYHNLYPHFVANCTQGEICQKKK